MGPDDVTTALSALGSSQSVTDAADPQTSTGSVIRATRIVKTDTGIVIAGLFANTDGSGPSTDEQNNVLSGQYLKDFAGGVFSPVSGFALGGSAGIGDSDQTAIFSGAPQGTAMNVVGDSFTKGNLFGFVMYATPLDADATLLGGLVAVQVSKLP